MASTASKWLIGCAAGCGLVLLCGVVLIVAGSVWMKRTMHGFDTAVDTREQLEERFGRADVYVPPPQGPIAADRIRAFLAVREASAPARTALGEAFRSMPVTDEQARELDAKPFWEKMRSVLGIAGTAVGLAGKMGDFFQARNAALLDQAMGLGEYTYLYVVIYLSWLGHAPDGSDAVADASQANPVRGEMFDDIEGRLHDDLIAMLEHQLDALPATDGSTDDADWRHSVEFEIEAMRRDRDRLPWAAGAPERITASLEPFREALVASWDPTTVPFELMRNTRQGRFSYSAD